MTETKKQPSLRDLRATQKLLHRAHDYVEANGFNIEQYAGDNGGEDYSLGRKGKLQIGPCCYIGSIRLAAGVNPEPSEGTAVGDGLELLFALEAADEVARKALPKDGRTRQAVEEYALRSTQDEDEDATEPAPGRLIEALGLYRAGRFGNEGEADAKQAKRALALLRRALTSVSKQIDARTA